MTEYERLYREGYEDALASLNNNANFELHSFKKRESMSDIITKYNIPNLKITPIDPRTTEYIFQKYSSKNYRLDGLQNMDFIDPKKNQIGVFVEAPLPSGEELFFGYVICCKENLHSLD